MAAKKKSARTAKAHQTSSETPAQTTHVKRNNKIPFAIGVALVGLLALLYALRGYFVAATVNGDPVSRVSVIRELEKQSGQQALDSLVTKQLILQEAKEKSVSISQEEVSNEIKTIEANLQTQGQTLDTALEQQGLTRSELQERIRVQKILEKMLGDKAKVSQKEVDEFVETNPEVFTPEASPEAKQVQAREQLSQQKFSESVQSFIEELRKKANIKYFVDY